MLEIANPFADYGAIVSGNRFIGRTHQLLQIQRRVIENGSNLSIVGERRVGKSSLAHQALIVQANELHKQGIVPVWIDTATYGDPHHLFCGIVKWCFWELEDCLMLSRELRDAAQAVHGDPARFDYDQVQFFFQQIHRRGLRIVLVFDEFDHVGDIFRTEPNTFHQLSAMCNRHQSTIVTVSRRSVRVLEQRAGADTPFARTFEPCYVGMFTPDEMEQVIIRIVRAGLALSQNDITQIHEHCGGHPFLFDMVASALIEHFRSKACIDTDVAIDQNAAQIYEYYEDLVERLDADGWLALIQALIHGEPVIPDDIPPELQKYEIVWPGGNGKYVTFSHHFKRYLDRIRPRQEGELTKRELDILRLLALGRQNKEIARALSISPNTVKFHVTNLCTKLGAANRGEAAARARELQLIP